jgi:hypothetical protein
MEEMEEIWGSLGPTVVGPLQELEFALKGQAAYLDILSMEMALAHIMPLVMHLLGPHIHDRF